MERKVEPFYCAMTGLGQSLRFVTGAPPDEEKILLKTSSVKSLVLSISYTTEQKIPQLRERFGEIQSTSANQMAVRACRS